MAGDALRKDCRVTLPSTVYCRSQRWHEHACVCYYIASMSLFVPMLAEHRLGQTYIHPLPKCFENTLTGDSGRGKHCCKYRFLF